jgi:hypothetical protein
VGKETPTLALPQRGRELTSPRLLPPPPLAEQPPPLPSPSGGGWEGVNYNHSPVAPVELSQAIIGPGVAIFSRYDAVPLPRGQDGPLDGQRVTGQSVEGSPPVRRGLGIGSSLVSDHEYIVWVPMGWQVRPLGLLRTWVFFLGGIIAPCRPIALVGVGHRVGRRAVFWLRVRRKPTKTIPKIPKNTLPRSHPAILGILGRDFRGENHWIDLEGRTAACPNAWTNRGHGYRSEPGSPLPGRRAFNKAAARLVGSRLAAAPIEPLPQHATDAGRAVPRAGRWPKIL